MVKHSSKPSHPCFCAYNRTMDLKTPRNVKLTAFYRRSFAFRTVRERIPVLLTKIIDTLSQKKDIIAREYGDDARDELKTVTGKISRLKYEIQTNKPLKNIRSQTNDASIYNECIKETAGCEGEPTPFHTVWLLVECYVYRKVREAFEKTKLLRDFDPFRFGKEELYHSGLPQIKETIHLLHNCSQTPIAKKEDFCALLHANLWSNKSDLSLSPEGVKPVLNDQLSEWSQYILVDDSEKVWDALVDSEGDTIDFILDNVGAELIADLALCDYLMTNGFCRKVILHCKKIPWFLSDTKISDVKWTLDQLCKVHDEPLLLYAGDRWSKYLENYNWILRANEFWTLPVDFSMMHKYDSMLYSDLSSSKMIFIKGDLNYRKVVRELNYDPETPLECAQGYFGPSRICCIRTIKSEIICGLPKGVAERCDKENSKWMEIGDYGIIQYTDKIVPLMEEDDVRSLSFYGIIPTRQESAISEWSGHTMNEYPNTCLCRN